VRGDASGAKRRKRASGGFLGPRSFLIVTALALAALMGVAAIEYDTVRRSDEQALRWNGGFCRAQSCRWARRIRLTVRRRR